VTPPLVDEPGHLVPRLLAPLERQFVLLHPYAVAIYFVMVASVLTALMTFLVKTETHRFFLFVGAVTLSAGYGGLRSGVLATALSIVILEFFFLPAPRFVFSLERALLFSLFTLICGVISWREEVRRRSETERARLYAKGQAMGIAQERQRLARDLHDAVSQTLYSATVIAESLPRLWERDPERTPELLEQLLLLNKGAMAELRVMLWELRPEAFEKTTLEELFHQLVDAFRGRTKIHFELTVVMGNADPLPDPVRIAFYRVAQEALANVVKHSQAQHATVVLASLPEQLELTITDDGKGFDAKRTSAGLGMGTMRERAAGIKAIYTLTSTEGQGTQVTLVWRR
jgi:signal transduction histidine kinase